MDSLKINSLKNFSIFQLDALSGLFLCTISAKIIKIMSLTLLDFVSKFKFIDY